jgi:uncharacterized protein (TIGR03663 family)
MTRASAAALVVVALAAGLALRLARLDSRPMHHDEANQAVKFGELVEHGEYRYDTHDHHGPTLYYLTLPFAWLRGQTTLAALDETTVRLVPVAFGAATILLFPLLAPGVGRTAAGALLTAVSPAMVYYSRMYIQESLFACFTLGFVIALGRAVGETGLRWPLLAGVAAGLAMATKETAALVLPAAVVAVLLARSVRLQADPDPVRLKPDAVRLKPDTTGTIGFAAGTLTAAAVAALFYSAFLTDPAGMLGPLRAAGTYVDRGIAPATHVQPWHYYLSLVSWSASGGLRWTEAAVVLLAVIGMAAAVWPRQHDGARPAAVFWTRYIAIYVVLATTAFSAIPYKTPWNLLPFYIGILMLAGIGFSTLYYWCGGGALAPRLASGGASSFAEASEDRSALRVLRPVLTLLLLLASTHLAWQAWRASVPYGADPRNPYVYAHTVPDAVRMARRIHDLATLHPEGTRMQVSVIAPAHEQWPLPWYLRAMPNVGYWTEPGDPVAEAAPLIVSAATTTERLDAVLGDRYVSEFFGLRPEVLLALYIDRELWDRFLARATTSDATP